MEQSASDFVKSELAANGYPDSKVHVREMFPTLNERATPLEVTQLAVGFHFDDGGVPAEMGSSLTRRVYTIEFWTFGTTPTYGRNVANVIKTFIERNGWLIPLKDIGQVGAPVIDQLVVLDDRGIKVQKQIANDPRPWDLNVYTTTVRVEDVYFP